MSEAEFRRKLGDFGFGGRIMFVPATLRGLFGSWLIDFLRKPLSATCFDFEFGGPISIRTKETDACEDLGI